MKGFSLFSLSTTSKLCKYNKNIMMIRPLSIMPPTSLLKSSLITLSTSLVSSSSSSSYNYISTREMSKSHKKRYSPKENNKPKRPYPDFPVHDREIDEELAKIDTTLTPDQSKYVEMLKKKIRGGVNSPRSIYREVKKYVIIIIKMIIKFYNIYYNIGSYTGRN
jgi:hypothetical protein